MLNLVNNCCTRIAAACCRNYGKTPKADSSKPAVNQVAQNVLNQDSAAIAAAVALADSSKASQIAMQLSPYAPVIAATVGHPAAAASAEDVTLRKRKPYVDAAVDYTYVTRKTYKPHAASSHADAAVTLADSSKASQLAMQLTPFAPAFAAAVGHPSVEQEPTVAFWDRPHPTGSNVTKNPGAGAAPSHSSLREEILSKIDEWYLTPRIGMTPFMDMFNTIHWVEARSQEDAIRLMNEKVAHIAGDPLKIEELSIMGGAMVNIVGSKDKINDLKKNENFVFVWKEKDEIGYVFSRKMLFGGAGYIGEFDSTFHKNLLLSLAHPLDSNADE